MGNLSIALGTIFTIQVLIEYLDIPSVFIKKRYNAYTMVNLQIHCSLYESVVTKFTIEFRHCIRRLMVLKEVTIDFMSLYVCVSIV